MAMPYDPANKKAEALIKAGLMEPAPKPEGGPQPVSRRERQRREEQTQAP